jgi:hypothetical protein
MSPAPIAESFGVSTIVLYTSQIANAMKTIGVTG